MYGPRDTDMERPQPYGTIWLGKDFTFFFTLHTITNAHYASTIVLIVTSTDYNQSQTLKASDVSVNDSNISETPWLSMPPLK